MIAAVRPEANFLRRNERIAERRADRADVVLFLPFRRWVDTEQCAASHLAAELTKANIQYIVVSEDEFANTEPRGIDRCSSSNRGRF